MSITMGQYLQAHHLHPLDYNHRLMPALYNLTWQNDALNVPHDYKEFVSMLAKNVVTELI